MRAIRFFYHTDFFLSNEAQVADWLLSVLTNEGVEVLSVDYSFVDKKQMIKINKKHLKHNYLTDVLAFDYSENNKIQGDVFISEEKVRANAQEYSQDFSKELINCLNSCFRASCSSCENSDSTSASRALAAASSSIILVVPSEVVRIRVELSSEAFL